MASPLTLAHCFPELPRPAVAATIAKVVGSAPQEPGAKIWVGRERVAGTIGGGEFELRVIKRCREMLASGAHSPLLEEFVLCREMGQCCGGRVQVFFETVPPRRRAVLFGAGHVGRAAAEVLSQTPIEVVLVDSRPEWAEGAGLPKDVQVGLGDPLERAQAQAWSGMDAACIFTHSHDLDFELVKILLPKPLGYLGLIGSEHKADVFRARLQSLPGGEGLAGLWDEKMKCPIGSYLPSKNPKVIAISIAAQLLGEWGLRA